MEDAFRGEFVNTVVYPVCQVTSTAFKPFWDVQLELSANSGESIEECLESMFGARQLDAKCMWLCPN